MLKSDKIRKTGFVLIILFVIIFTQSACSLQIKDKQIPVRVLILPKFEAGELAGDFPGEAWAQRQPQVLRGTSLSGDNYWKGINDHNNALLITETYKCTDPYAITEMEDVATALAVQRLGLLDRLIILRAAVNIDVFPSGVTPEMLWGADDDDSIASEDSMESVDIFETAMENCFNVGKVLIDGILEGTL